MEILRAQFVAFLLQLLAVSVLASQHDSSHGVDATKATMDIIVDANKDSRVLSGLQEGDIRLHRDKRNAIRITQWKWKDNKVYYVIEEKGISDYGLKMIRDAIDEYNSVQSCVKWIPRKDEHDYVVIKDGYGCHSSIGRDGGPQDLVLGSACYYKGVIMHEMNHAVGFFHEQARYDRDKYVQVNWDNIIDGKIDDFKKQMPNIMDTFEAPYDYGSIMHYGPTTFSKNGNPTLKAIFDDQGTMGQRAGFSDVDIWKIEKLYDCKTGKPPLPAWMQTAQTTASPMVPPTISTKTGKPTKTTVTPSATQRPTTYTTLTVTPPSTTPKPCDEEKTLPPGIPGKVQNFQAVVIENTVRVFWEPPCTSVPLQAYLLTYVTGQKQSSILIHPDRQTHYIYTATHPGSRYQMTIAAQSIYGRGETSNAISTYSACGHDIVLPENGTFSSIKSPYFDQEMYEPDVACQWNIEVPKGQRIKIKFDTLNLAGTGSCDQDFLLINDKRYCNDVPPSRYIKTTGNTAKIVFLSRPGPSNKQGGFNISVEAVDYKPKKPTVINGPGYIALSWSPPEDVSGLNYSYIFKYRLLPEMQQEIIQLSSSLRQFGFPTGHHIGREYEIELSTVINNKEGNSHTIRVRSECGRNITVTSSGQIHNPPSLGIYEPDVVCNWRLYPSSGKGLLVGFSDLDLEVSPSCVNDFVDVSGLGRYCTISQVTKSLTTSSDVMVQFKSNGNVERRGFVLQYQLEP